jgi:hypothetical protein
MGRNRNTSHLIFVRTLSVGYVTAFIYSVAKSGTYQTLFESLGVNLSSLMWQLSQIQMLSDPCHSHFNQGGKGGTFFLYNEKDCGPRVRFVFMENCRLVTYNNSFRLPDVWATGHHLMVPRFD